MEKRAAIAAERKKQNLPTLLGRLLLEARTRKGLSISDLGRQTRYSRSLFNLIENSQRSAEPDCLIELARVLDLDPATLLHAAHRDRLAQQTGAVLPQGASPTLLLNYLAARELQEQHLPFSVGLYRMAGIVFLDGSLMLDRRYEHCRPNAAGQPVNDLIIQERIIGGKVDEYDGDTMEVFAKPLGLETKVDTERSGEWLRHHLRFPGGWKRAGSLLEDELSFGFRRRFAKVYAADPREYIKNFKTISPAQPFVGKASAYVPQLVSRFEIDWTLPEQTPAGSWQLRTWWGADPGALDRLDPQGLSRSVAMETTPTTGRLSIDRPLAGYTYSLQWSPASPDRPTEPEGGSSEA